MNTFACSCTWVAGREWEGGGLEKYETIAFTQQFLGLGLGLRAPDSSSTHDPAKQAENFFICSRLRSRLSSMWFVAVS